MKRPYVFAAGILSKLVLTTRIRELTESLAAVPLLNADLQAQARIETSGLLSLMSTRRSTSVSDDLK